MNKQQLIWMRRVALLAILLCPAALAWSDGAFPTHDSEAKKTCYCGCDMKAGSPMCMHMCELPKYANRSWAVACEKKIAAASPAATSQSKTHSKKTNKIQKASL
jgi:hypothetical protein